MEKTSLLIKKFYFFMGNIYHIQSLTIVIKTICTEGKRDFSLPTPNSDKTVIRLSSQLAQPRVSCCLLSVTEVNLLAILIVLLQYKSNFQMENLTVKYYLNFWNIWN